ncbi:MAG: hypothetical protein LUG13_04005 [Oscillospiraceae bacterium]|nr:hypothetical protein [Oscillospiraceae bacterium]
MKKKQVKRCVLPFLALVLLLSGCSLLSVDELYAMPQPPEEYYALQTKIKEISDQGGEYTAPQSGKYIQSVLLQDLTGDGVQEAIAFFRFSSGETPLKIFIFAQKDDEYELLGQIDGSGTAIDSISFEDLNDSAAKELVVSWQMEDKLHALSAYSIENGEIAELMRSDYTAHKIYDIDSDGQKEILIVKTAAAEEADRAELYNWRDGTMLLDSVAPLSKGISGAVEGGVLTGYLRDNTPALFVPSNYGETGFMIDIFAWRNEKLENITLDPEQGASVSTIRYYNGVSSTDINGDGIMEVPIPSAIPASTGNLTTVVNFWAILWQQYDSAGNVYPLYTTYYNESDGWFFILPDAWEGKITLERKDQPEVGERAVIFSYRPDENTEPEPFLTLYTLSGSNRQRRAAQEGRFSLRPDASTEETYLYAAEFNACSWDCGMDESDAIAAFSLIKSGWTS